MGIKRNAIKCLDCGSVIESTHRHDWRQCACGHAFVDGGLEYLRRGFVDPSRVEDLSEYDEEDAPATGDDWTTSETGF